MPKQDKYEDARKADYIPWERMTGIQKAITLAGSQNALAQFLSGLRKDRRVSQQAVSEWEKRGYVPDGWILEVEAEYKIDRVELINPATRRLLETR